MSKKRHRHYNNKHNELVKQNNHQEIVNDENNVKIDNATIELPEKVQEVIIPKKEEPIVVNETKEPVIQSAEVKEPVEKVINKINVEPKKKYKWAILYFILAMLIVITVGYFIYNNFVKIKNPLEETIEPNSNTNVSEIISLGKDKFEWMNAQVKRETNNPVFFTDSNLDTSNILSEDVLDILYNALASEDKNSSGTTDDSCFKSSATDVSTYPSTCYQERFDKNLLQDQANSLFASTLKVNYSNFLPTGSKACYLNNTTYTCVLKMNSINIGSVLVITGFDHAEYQDNNLIVYSKLLTVKRTLDIYPSDVQGIYTDITASKKIDNITYYNEVTANGLDSDARTKLINKYQDSISTYKSTFVRNSDGSFVWNKTEKLN